MSTTDTSKPRHFDEDFKMEVAGSYLRGDGTYRTLEKKYGVSKSRIHSWVRNFAKKINATPSEVMNKKPTTERQTSGNTQSAPTAQEKEIASLREQLKQAKKDLAYERMRADVYDRMIDLAENRWKIEIRKNLVPNSEKPVRAGLL